MDKRLSVVKSKLTFEETPYSTEKAPSLDIPPSKQNTGLQLLGVNCGGVVKTAEMTEMVEMADNVKMGLS